MYSFITTLRVRLLFATVVLLAGATACGGAAKAATPAQLVAGPESFDGQSVNVSGTAKDPHTRKTRRGELLMYQLCDAQCVNVVQFGADAASVTDGSTVSVTGMFHESFGRVRKFSNVVVVGGRQPGS